MRLINVHTRQFEEFVGNKIPQYAILSHTWEAEVVSNTDFLRGGYEQMEGFSKIDMTCRMAEMWSLSYAWVDTCCINKSSSAELSEAINSMFRWYQDALICYVYLSDMQTDANWELCLQDCRWSVA